jgi:hypothetical protein
MELGKIGNLEAGVLGTQDLVLRLDQEQDQRQLTTNEILLHKEAKSQILGMAVIMKFKLRQRS